MNPNIPSIDQLKELGLPAPVSYAPQTWGWWVLLGLLVIAVVLVSARKVWQWRRDRYRREGLVRLAELQRRSDDLSALRELPELLKRVALSIPNPVGAKLARDGRYAVLIKDRVIVHRGQALLLQGVGALSGEEWQAFLQLHSPKPLPANFSQQLAQLAYAPDATLLALPDEHRQHLFATCKLWVEHHHVAA
ncbi:DUF4381 domain-containing protein [Pseudomonas frederiksbergensis]|uniref:DUF4381 domain-containing protein n=1 Tax=Pseudomonas frederiksbergensis TaxID=104087 RepID=UPI003D045B6C